MVPARSDVYSLDEIARAAGVPVRSAEQLVRTGILRPIAGSRYVSGPAAIDAGRRLRANALAQLLDAPAAPLGTGVLFPDPADSTPVTTRRRQLPLLASPALHTVAALLLLWLSAGTGRTAPVDVTPSEPARLVFIVSPGPGGGGGGGGTRARTPAPRLERRAERPVRAVNVPTVTPDPVLTTARRIEPPPRPTPVVTQPQPTPVERATEPLPTRTIVAPVVEMASSSREQAGVIEPAVATTTASQGSGVGGGAGTGAGTGNGQGLGSGIGDGAGGGTGGGPYRPGSGVEPPRLLREVKADYTDDARRRGISGDVVLEIVVRRDGSVGDVKVLQGLGGGLESRAVTAVKQWRFAPARRHGEAVDVIVEVAVEFTLR